MKIKLTVVDIFIICITLVVVLFAAYRIAERNSPVASNRQPRTIADVTIQAEIRKEYGNNISVGDTLVDSASGLIIGHISKIEYSDYIVHHKSSETDVSHPEIISANITFSTDVNNGSYSVFPLSRIVIGQEYSLVAPDLFFHGTCMSVVEHEEEFGMRQPR